MTYETILFDVSDHVATITLNRPERLNAVTKGLEAELLDAMRRVDQDDAVRVVILTGAGRGFCAGADLEVLDSIASVDWTRESEASIRETFVPPVDWDEAAEDFQRTYGYFPAVRKPIIASVNGPAVGLGFIFALYCDMRFAAASARFGTAFAQRGLIAEHGVSWLLPRLVGTGNAFDLLYSARLVDADEAARMGFVNRVLPDGELESFVRDYAVELATTVSPRSTRVMKKQIWEGLFQSLGEAVDAANREMVLSFQCEDFREGVAHFVEKRAPRFTGR